MQVIECVLWGVGKVEKEKKITQKEKKSKIIFQLCVSDANKITLFLLGCLCVHEIHSCLFIYFRSLETLLQQKLQIMALQYLTAAVL